MLDKSKILEQLANCNTEEQLKEFHQNFLGKKGEISLEFKTLGKLSPEERKAKGQELADIKGEVEKEYNSKIEGIKIAEINAKLDDETIDITTPSIKTEEGYYNLISKTRRRMEDSFQSMGFNIEYGHELVTKFENFYSVNIPSTHPATEVQDTFYFDQKNADENLVFRSQTSAMQNKYIKKYGTPLKVIVPGKVYRQEKMDASHDTMFRQLEGMVIDKNISIANFKSLITKILSDAFETDVTIRMRPGYFPFVEPGFEIDASCPICKGDGCKLCKQTGWIEILGAGMIHRNVLKEAGVDINEYSGLAFGIGINRLVAIRYGIKDIRLFTNGDLRFIETVK